MVVVYLLMMTDGSGLSRTSCAVYVGLLLLITIHF